MAVLLHYLYLVSFMWMLMEGVVLYVVLVKVFERKTKKYYLIFTLLSYGKEASYTMKPVYNGHGCNREVTEALLEIYNSQKLTRDHITLLHMCTGRG